MYELELKQVISRLLPGKLYHAISIHPIAGGKNNRAFHIQLDDEEFFLKQYSPAGDRNRLLSEYQFLLYANRIGSDYITRPIACNTDMMFGLYQYQSGERYMERSISDNDINHAIQFLYQINSDRHYEKSHIAQEACFSISEHIDCIQKRINKLNHMVISDDLDEQVNIFIYKQLNPAWNSVKKNVFEYCRKHNLLMNELIEEDDRIISPSDFGFHNAIKLKNNKLIFVDFEYAGWDDPSKLIGDFFHQIEVPVSLRYFEKFSKSISSLCKNQEKILGRVHILFPVYCIKWCCIILNYFLPGGKIWKNFTEVVTRSVREVQFQKAQKRLQTLRMEING